MQCCVDQKLTDQVDAVMQHLRAADLTVVTAESCTGGLIDDPAAAFNFNSRRIS
jgi:nicotinamide mononucleotide (NMN) deamidase PncC